MKKTLLTLLLLISFSTNSFALSTDPEGQGTLSVARCLEKGSIDFSLFINSVVYFDGFQEGLIEPWVDVLVRNQCQAGDISNLIKQQDALQAVIQQKLLTCSTESIDRLEKFFNRITAEIYYVRHVIDSNLARSISANQLDNSTPNADTKASKAEKLEKSSVAQSILTDRDKLYKSMYEKYVRANFFDPGEFDKFFRDMESKYSDRKYDYISCDNGDWEAVSKKFEEFVAYWTGDGKDSFNGQVKKFENDLSSRADALGKEIESAKTIELLKGDISVENYVNSFFDVNINQLDPETFAQVLNEYIDPLVADTSITASPQDVINSIYNSAEALEGETLERQMRANFTNLYLTVSDDSLELFLNSLDGRDSPKEGLIEILLNSFPQMAKVLNGVKCVNDKQCSG